MLERKHPGKVLWETCELQGLGGVFHTPSNPRHSSKNIAMETSPKNVRGKCLWGRGSGKGIYKRIWKRLKARPQKRLWQNVSGKTCLKSVPETAHEARPRKPSLGTLGNSGPEQSPEGIWARWETVGRSRAPKVSGHAGKQWARAEPQRYLGTLGNSGPDVSEHAGK